MKKYVFWALFDSGNGCYFNASRDFENIEIYSIGLDIENKNTHFTNLNLATYNYFGKNEVYEVLDNLPKPDVIIASPPCESWSVASAMTNGNACWKQETGDSLFSPQIPLSKFTVRDYNDYKNWQYIPEKQIIKRINGELCTFNLIQIIKKYEPKIYIIENPSTSKIWDYIDTVLGFNLKFDNLVRYNNYDSYPTQKPTKFKSNIELKLKNKIIKNNIDFNRLSGYNNRSNIPLSLVKDIFKQVLEILDIKEKYNGTINR